MARTGQPAIDEPVSALQWHSNRHASAMLTLTGSVTRALRIENLAIVVERQAEQCEIDQLRYR